MSLHPLDGETRAEILSDHRKRRGPFTHPIVAVHELVAHYTVVRIKTTQARALLRGVSAREVLTGSRGQPAISLFVVSTDSRYQALPRLELLGEYRAARGLR